MRKSNEPSPRRARFFPPHASRPRSVRHVPTRPRFLARPLLRRPQPPELPSTGRRRDGRGRDAATAPREGRIEGHREEHVRNPDLARWWSWAHGYVRHEAGRPGRVSRHLEADPHQGAGLRHHRTVSQTGEGDGQVLDRAVAAPRHRRPLRWWAPDAHHKGYGRERGEQPAEVPRDWGDRQPRTRRPREGHAGLHRHPARGEHRARAGLLRRAHARHAARPVRDRRPQRARISRCGT